MSREQKEYILRQQKKAIEQELGERDLRIISIIDKPPNMSGDMIEGTITATLLQRANPGAIEARKEAAGRLYNVGEFAAEVALAAVEPIPADNTRYVGDVSDFLAASS